MKIVEPTGDSVLKLIFRPHTILNASYKLEIRSKSTNVVTTLDITPIANENYFNVDLTNANKTTAQLVEGNYYEITVYDSNSKNGLLTRETLFCTSQLINQETNAIYNANKGLYKEVISENKYIILE